MNSVKYKKTGESGMRMTLMSVQWIGGREAEAKVQAYSDGMAANGNILRIVFKEGRRSDEVNGVS
jgi:hypothetical protein